jgi:hypothetical protein
MGSNSKYFWVPNKGQKVDLVFIMKYITTTQGTDVGEKALKLLVMLELI